MITILSLIIIIILHEIAHLLVALGCGIKVKSVNLGFGKKIMGFKFKGIEYNFNWIPFGGSCELEGELNKQSGKKSFSNLPYRKKAAIALAGVVLNILMGVVIIPIGFYFNSQAITLFGLISLVLGLTNSIPIIPCLDLGYVFYIPILEKIYGKKQGYAIFAKLVKWSFWGVVILNIICLPLIIIYSIKI